MTLSHRERYQQVLSVEYREALLKVIADQGYPSMLTVERARIVEGEPWPYLRLELGASERFVALAGGMYLDLEGVVPDPPTERYYLPYVGLTPRAQPADLEHELQHLRDLLDLLESDPAYSANAERFGVYNVDDPALIEDSARFEVKKLFRLEVPCFQHEYEVGKGIIEVPLVPGKSVEYRCSSLREYLSMWLLNYMDSLRKTYVQRFPGCDSQIVNALAAATNELGVEALGPNPWEALERTRAKSDDRITAQVLGGQDGPALRAWLLKNASSLLAQVAAATASGPEKNRAK